MQKIRETPGWVRRTAVPGGIAMSKWMRSSVVVALGVVVSVATSTPAAAHQGAGAGRASKIERWAADTAARSARATFAKDKPKIGSEQTWYAVDFTTEVRYLKDFT
ncbi:MAG: hypothetical protein ACRDKY_05990, partial [Solirubrobacteraceae bacterium]